MRKLLSASFSRLWRSRLFCIEMVIAVAMAGLLLFANQFNGSSSIKYMDFPYFSQYIYNPVVFTAFITAVAISFAVMLMVSMIAGTLYAPEMVYEYTEKTANGLIYGPLIPNPGYIRGTARNIAEWVNDILPQGQLYSVYSYDFDRYARWPVMAVVVMVASTALGYYLFSKKEIK